MKKKSENSSADKHGRTRINSDNSKNIYRRKSLKYLCLSAFICGLISLLLVFPFFDKADFASPNRMKFSPFSQEVSAEDASDEIETALYTKQEFFGAQATVPLPTSEARANLVKLAEAQPDNRQVLEKLAEKNEKLGRFDEAETVLIRLAEIDFSTNETLAAFYGRRAQFEKEAEVLRKILFSIRAEKRAATFERLIDLARVHDLQAYLQPDFYALVAAENPNLYEIFERLVGNLVEEKNYSEALKFLRQAKAQFPERSRDLLDKEIEILLETNRGREAEAIYQASFNPFWSTEEADKFYEFLSNRDRLRAYGAELKAKFKRNPADFDAGVRLALYRRHDYGDGEVASVASELEAAKKSWSADELVIITRLLLKENAGEAASRFLYTLYLRDDFKNNPEFRAKILYQLFEMFSDAENQKLPLTGGDLRFYADVARADTNPGIATGILSLVFSDTNPRAQLERQEEKATKFFNRAAAYRIFLAYREEFPASTELAQMYLDIVRLYAATNEPDVAEKTLNEFAARYENSQDYPAAALKLADAFVAAEQSEKERETYRKILDYFGKRGESLAPETKENLQSSNEFQTSGAADAKKASAIVADGETNRNDGINIPKPDSSAAHDDFRGGNFSRDREPESVFRDYLARKTSDVTYAEVLEKFVASLAKEKKTAEILALYSNETNKYPNEEWLYERRVAWLEQANLIDEQSEIYKAALARFQSRGWQDKLARFFLREKKRDEFAEFSTELIGKLNDEEAARYLAQFVGGGVSGEEFEQRLYLKLYQSAHARFPHNPAFVQGLLRFYKRDEREADWRELCAAYYFESKEIREEFLNRLAETGELRNYLQTAKKGGNTIYELFRADASARLSDFENAVAAYRKLNEIYPNTPEFSERSINFTRSFGQKSRESLTEAANVSKSQADFLAASTEYRTRSGEIFAELGDYQTARGEWEKLIALRAGDREIYLDAATVYWDYFQYDDALRTIKNLREKFGDRTLYAFETGAILETQGKQSEAAAEYVKAFDANRDEGQKEKSKKQLAKSVAKFARTPNENLITGGRERGENERARDEFERTVETAFLNESARRKDASFLTLGYAEFLAKIKETEKAETVLNRAVSRSRDREFLEAARDFYQSEEIKAGEQIALKRLAETAESARQAIQFRLQSAENYEANKNRRAAKIVLAELVRKYPTNYGVLTEAADFYSRLGFENESVAVLRNALPVSRGEYRNALARKLASGLIRLDRLDRAERILSKMHDENKADTGVFDELAKIYVRRNDAAKMRKVFAGTVAALKETDRDRRELDAQIAALRRSMIDAFTRLEDYESAVEQHIEIVNREPENERLTEAAIKYVRRYGGAETLLNYYRRTAAEAFKNYRWNVVLARIYESNGDAENAVRNYETAIVNQPEMPELYAAIADIETKRNNTDEALRNLDTVLELTNDAPEYVRKKIEILKRAGRLREIEAEEAKLPFDAKPKIAVDQFAEARKLDASENVKALELYKGAFGRLFEKPLENDLKAADISAYVRAVRAEEPLDRINERLWTLREKLSAIAGGNDSTEAGEAKRRLSTLDGAIAQAVGDIAKTVATNPELAALHANLSARLNENFHSLDTDKTVALVQDLSRRAGFGDLEETILIRKLEAANLAVDRQTHLRYLIGFYDERGAYQKSFDQIEKTGTDDLPLKAEAARLVGNREKELEALRTIYGKPAEKNTASTDEEVARYLEILYAENAEELKSLTEKSSAHQLQTINFLLAKGEAELAHAAIENSNFPTAWKVSRNAETSLALKEFNDSDECYFCDALQFHTIGEMVRQTPDKERFLINDDWFRLTREYGEWVSEKEKTRTNRGERGVSEADKYSVAMTENLPQSAEEQSKLGAFYLERNEPEAAIEHLRLAIETENSAIADNAKTAALGAAYYKAGRRDDAEECFTRALNDGEAGEELKRAAVYFRTLRRYGLGEKAREKLPPVIVKFLAAADADDSTEFQNLIRGVAASFTDEAEKSVYFLRILKARPTDTSLAEMLTSENLIAENRQGEFYELLIERGGDLSYYDYNFTAVLQRVWMNASDAESVYDQENDYKIEEPDGKNFVWRKNYLELLVKQNENESAAKLIAAVERELNNRYARPDWLRLAKIKLQMRAGTFDAAQMKRFVGITVSDSATEIKPPSVERFNDALRILKDEKRAPESARLSESFFARMLALGQFDAANFVGLSRAFFQTGEAEKALHVLRLMVDACDEEERETAAAEIAALEAVKAQAADAAKLPETESVGSPNQSDASKLAAETALEFGRTDAAIAFRRRSVEVHPVDSDNRIELATLLVRAGDESAAANLLNDVVDDRNSLRSARFRARMILIDAGESAEFGDAAFDSFAQFYNGLLAENGGRRDAAIESFINSLVNDEDAETDARQKLIKLYASIGKPFAALKLAATDKAAKSDQLLDALSEAAEKIGDFQKAIEFERGKAMGAANAERIAKLQKSLDDKTRRATHFTVDLENTRKL